MYDIKQSIIVYNYFEYRTYLRDVYTYLKNTCYGFSYRSFAANAGIKNPNYLHRVIKGEHNLKGENIRKISRVLKLDPQEHDYFTTLIHFNNIKDPQEKETYLKKLLTLRHMRGIHKIEDKKLKFFVKWYYPVIRELVVFVDFKDDFNILARNCIPRISAVQAKGAVIYLLENGFIKKNSDGTYSQVHQTISTDDEVNSTILRKYHKKTLEICADALDTIKPDKRNISSYTMHVSEKTYRAMKKEMQDFGKRLLAMAREDTDTPEIACFAGLQLLPRSELNRKEEKKSRK
jgi:uncharacterized protein (TIGR02147 family)